MLGYLSLAACIALAFAASAQDDLKSAVNEVTTTKDGDVYCPVPLVGTHCGTASPFHYYECCGNVNKDCCFKLQTWVWVVIAVISVIVIASVILSVVRCICCSR
ncbi:unnamed protein product [Caenorhabditis bovis]|uniref:Uncharacterized protein n=1 Tax=Caenorhabditis bovis TaxID=2654633 RepID=A0A8S1EJK4_9PELO|nr:unnamed protein product [Caenorhabditis bovis]